MYKMYVKPQKKKFSMAMLMVLVVINTNNAVAIDEGYLISELLLSSSLKKSTINMVLFFYF
jgi:hypothetical protein